MKMNKKGFTLIELMIVVAIIGILAAIAIPKFADLINKSKEGATKGALSTVRSAIQVYYGDNEGWFPTDSSFATSVLSGAKYLNVMPVAKLPGTGHADSAAIANALADAGGWTYYNNPSTAASWGTFLVNCGSHQDLKGQVSGATNGTYWSAF
jgi:prepilin-type N-terminal cleavage/methylation domain-containing protein